MGMKDRNLTQIVFTDIREKILNYQLPPGGKISDKNIADRMEISRSPVRQALFRLVEQGLLEARHNRGFVVKVFSDKEIEDLYILREALELKAIELAIENLTPEIENALKNLLEQLKTSCEEQDVAGITIVDWKFHNQIIEASQNLLMIDFFKGLQDRIKIAFPHQKTPGSILGVIYDEHKQITDNLIYRNPDGAKYAMSSHIRDALRFSLD